MSLARFIKPIVSAEGDESVVAAGARLKAHDVGCLVITDGGRPVGIVTDRDLALRVVAEGRDPKTTKVRDVMTRDPVTLESTREIDEAFQLMEDNHVRRLPVVTELGNVIGILAADDLVSMVGRELEQLGRTFRAKADR